MKNTYLIEGMSGAGCIQAVTARAPDADVVVDLAKGTVTVADRTDAVVIRQAVEKAGSDFVGPA